MKKSVQRSGMVFVRRQLEHEAKTLGERLRLLRRTQAVTMDMLVAATRIQRRYLEALERGRYHELPDPLYTRNFIRSYARYLGADETYFLELFSSEVARSDLLAPHRLPRIRARKLLFLSTPQIFAALCIAGILSLGLFWLFSRIIVVFRPPELTLVAPEAFSLVHEPYIFVSGRMDDVNDTLRIADHIVPPAPDGSFEFEVPLQVGTNYIRVSSYSRFSIAAQEERVVVYQPLP